MCGRTFCPPRSKQGEFLRPPLEWAAPPETVSSTTFQSLWRISFYLNMFFFFFFLAVFIYFALPSSFTFASNATVTILLDPHNGNDETEVFNGNNNKPYASSNCTTCLVCVMCNVSLFSPVSVRYWSSAADQSSQVSGRSRQPDRNQNHQIKNTFSVTPIPSCSSKNPIPLCIWPVLTLVALFTIHE